MDWMEELSQQVIDGISITPAEAGRLIRVGDGAVGELISCATNITRAFHGRKVSLCSLVNAKSGLCQEDCAFCSQSTRFKTAVKRYPLLDSEIILESSKQAKETGAHEFCIVTSGGSLTETEFGKLLSIVDRIKLEVGIQVDVSVGFLSVKQAKRLKDAGVTRVNHNLQTSPDFYSRIVTTHRYSDRIDTLQCLRGAGLEICSGVILGLGESCEDRIRVAFELKKLDPECVPVNLLDPRPGTPLDKRPLLDPNEIIKTIAVFRFILPRTNLRLAGGRHLQLGELQPLALQAGINGLIIGQYLTTQGASIAKDFENLKRLGLEYHNQKVSISGSTLPKEE